MATVLRESGRAGNAGASVEDVAVGIAAVAVVALPGTAADDVAPAPARSQGLGGEPPVAMLRSLRPERPGRSSRYLLPVQSVQRHPASVFISHLCGIDVRWYTDN